MQYNDNIGTNSPSYCTQEYHKLHDFLDSFKLCRNDAKSPNIVDLHLRSRYFIPQEYLPIFYELLNECCITHKLRLCLGELQKEGENGIFLDIDYYHNENSRLISDEILDTIMKRYVYELSKFIIIRAEFQFTYFILQKPELLLINNQYKEGYHILFPKLWLPKYLRRLVLESLKLKFPYIDTATASNPSLFYRNVKHSDLNGIQCYEIKRKGILKIKPDTDFPQKPDVSFGDNSEDINNLIKELSLTYFDSFVISCEIHEDHKREIFDSNIALSLYKQDSLDELCFLNRTANTLYEYLDALPEMFYEERNCWRDIIYAIYNTGKDQFKPLAEWFSKKSQSKFDYKAFENLWLDTKKRHCANPITQNTIFYYVKEHNPDAYKELVKKSYINEIENYIHGSLSHYDIAKLLFNMLGSRIVYSQLAGRNYEWYCLIISKDNKMFYDEGQLYKWVFEDTNCSVSLSIFMSEEFPKFVHTVIDKIDKNLQKEESPIIIDKLKSKKKKLQILCFKLGDNGFKKSIIEQAKIVFRNSQFSKLLDSYDNILGVKNGILILPSKEKNIEKLIHIPSYHEYYISKYASVPFETYSMDSSPKILEIMKILHDIIPEDDALEYILLYLSTSISNEVKEPLILFLRGGGSNGKSTIMELMLNTMGEYAKKLSLGILTDKRESSEKSNSAFMDLKNARFGYFSEPNRSEIINTGRLKELLGNEKLTGRQCYGKQENFENKCNLVASSNYDFTINCSDHGIWRRIRYYECKIKFIENPNLKNRWEKKINKKLVTKLIKNEEYQKSFLYILTYYYSKYVNTYNCNLNNYNSRVIDYETNLYRGRQDYLHRFIKDCIIYSENNWVNFEYFYQQYREWIANKNTKIPIFSFDDVISQLENSAISSYIELDNDTKHKRLKNIRIEIPDVEGSIKLRDKEAMVLSI